MSKNALISAIKEHDAKFIDLRFTDTLGKEQHITIPATIVDDELVEHGKMFDGSSIKGWQEIHKSDLALIPDLEKIHLDPFFQENTLIVRCNVIDPQTKLGYDRDPRSIAQRAETYLQSTGIADAAMFGPEPEFFIFDDVRSETGMRRSFYELNSKEGHWNLGAEIEGGISVIDLA